MNYLWLGVQQYTGHFALFVYHNCFYNINAKWSSCRSRLMIVRSIRWWSPPTAFYPSTGNTSATRPVWQISCVIKLPGTYLFMVFLFAQDLNFFFNYAFSINVSPKFFLEKLLTFIYSYNSYSTRMLFGIFTSKCSRIFSAREKCNSIAYFVRNSANLTSLHCQKKLLKLST